MIFSKGRWEVIKWISCDMILGLSREASCLPALRRSPPEGAMESQHDKAKPWCLCFPSPPQALDHLMRRNPLVIETQTPSASAGLVKWRARVKWPHQP